MDDRRFQLKFKPNMVSLKLIKSLEPHEQFSNICIYKPHINTVILVYKLFIVLKNTNNIWWSKQFFIRYMYMYINAPMEHNHKSLYESELARNDKEPLSWFLNHC